MPSLPISSLMYEEPTSRIGRHVSIWGTGPYRRRWGQLATTALRGTSTTALRGGAGVKQRSLEIVHIALRRNVSDQLGHLQSRNNPTQRTTSQRTRRDRQADRDGQENRQRCCSPPTRPVRRRVDPRNPAVSRCSRSISRYRQHQAHCTGSAICRNLPQYPWRFELRGGGSTVLQQLSQKADSMDILLLVSCLLTTAWLQDEHSSKLLTEHAGEAVAERRAMVAGIRNRSR
jgi:hypothetical protein